jgi:hypothetical protein
MRSSLKKVDVLEKSSGVKIRLTIDTRAGLTVASEGGMLRRTRWARWTRHMPLHALALRLLLWRRSKSRTTLGSSTRHDALEQVCRPVADGRRRWLRRAIVR